jgi:hypothetical protein
MASQFFRNTNLPIAAILFWLIPLSLAQTGKEGGRPPDGGTREVLVSIFIPTVSGAPFTATVNTETVRPLLDGTRITLTNHRLIARDRSGRIFQERRLLVPEDKKDESIITQIEISDPVARKQYICVPSERVCQLEFLENHEPVQSISAVTPPPLNPGQEFAGTQSISGLKTEGTRETRVIPTGAIGNDSPILSKREFWYSQQLGLNVLSTRDDPRFGTQKFELSDIVLSDPDTKLFSPPEGFKLLDLRNPTEVPSTPASN